MKFLTRRIKDPFPGLSHWVGALLSLAALAVLLSAAAGRPIYVAAFTIYGVSLITLYTASALAHSVRCSPRVEARLDAFDFCAIFLLIAGTYTPFCLLALRGRVGWGILIGEWLMAAIGIASVLLGLGVSRAPRAAIYAVMGWLGILAAAPMARALPAAGIAWLLGGGVIYSLGAVVFVTNRPRLWPGRFVAHDLWHLMVMAGSACHFIVMLWFLAPVSAA